MPTARCVALKTLASSVTKTSTLEMYDFQVNVNVNKPRKHFCKPDFFFCFCSVFKSALSLKRLYCKDIENLYVSHSEDFLTARDKSRI